MLKQEDMNKGVVIALSKYIKSIGVLLEDYIIDLIHERLFEPVEFWHDIRVRIDLEGLASYVMFSIKYIPESENLVISFRLPLGEDVMTGYGLYTVHDDHVVQTTSLNSLKSVGITMSKEQIVPCIFGDDRVMNKVSASSSLSYILDVLKMVFGKYSGGMTTNCFLNMIDKLGVDGETRVEFAGRINDKSLLMRLAHMGESGSIFTVDTPDIHLNIPAIKKMYLPPIAIDRKLFVTSFEKLALAKSTVFETSTIQ